MASWTSWNDFALDPGFMPSPWLVALDDLRTATRLRLSVTGTWTIAEDLLLPCGPDGYAGLPLVETALVLASAPAGALIGKFGGSSAAVGPAGATEPPLDAPFMIGSACELAVPAKAAPLMIGFNTALGRVVQIAEFKIEVKALLA
jgi:hypothetical protein